MKNEIRCQHNDDWQPAKGGTLVGWVEDGRMWRAAARVREGGGRVHLDPRWASHVGVSMVWCPRCGRGYCVSAEKLSGGRWEAVGDVFVALMGPRREGVYKRF